MINRFFKNSLMILVCITSILYASQENNKESKKAREKSGIVLAQDLTKMERVLSIIKYSHLTYHYEEPHDKEMESLLKEGLDPNTRISSWKGSQSILNALASQRIDLPNTVKDLITTEKMVRQKVEFVGKLLIQHGADTNDSPALYNAARNGYPAIMKLLLRNKDIDIMDDSEESHAKHCLLKLAYINDIEIENETSRLLLLNGATVNLYKNEPEVKEFLKQAKSNLSWHKCFDKNLQHRLLRYAQMPIDGTFKKIQRKQGAPYNIHRACFNQQSSQKPGHRPLKTQWPKQTKAAQDDNVEQKVEKESSSAK